jgi:hypothetical protein
MSFKERNRKLIDAAKKIKDFCDNNECDDCPFSDSAKFYIDTCRLYDGIPKEWDLPEEEVQNDD